MKTLALLLLLSLPAFAQDVKRGSFLKKRAYQTYSTLTLYVDPTGSDSNPCTASGTSACATLAGAMAKVPSKVRHNVTINVAAGTYSEALNVRGFTIDVGVTFSVTGVMSNVTPATGTGSGTATSGTGGTSASPASLTDSSQTWTVDDLRGKFVTFTSGSLNGNSFPIVSNTATTLYTPITTTITAGTTYVIQTQGTVFSSASLASHVESNTGGGQLIFSYLKVLTGGEFASLYASNSTFTQLLSCAVERSSGSTVAVVAHLGGPLYMQRSWIQDTTANVTAALYVPGVSAATAGVTGGVIFGPPQLLSFTNSAIRATSASALFFDSPWRLTVVTSYLESNATTSYGVLTFTEGEALSSFTGWIHCLDTADPGITAFGSARNTSALRVGSTTLGITDCSVGVSARRGITITMASSATFSSVTTAASASSGGIVDFNGITPTFTGVTNELQLDGENFTFSMLTGLTSPQVISNSSGSTILR